MSENFTDPLLVSVYDDLNPWGPSDEFYYQLAKTRGGSVLDVGCGTGTLACRLAKEGVEVSGVDPAPAMLQIASEKPGGKDARWHESDVKSLKLEEEFHTIVMTGHAFQVFLSDLELRDSLQSIVRHLSPQGVFVFESRNPRDRAWLRWRQGSEPLRIRSRSHGEIEDSGEGKQKVGIHIEREAGGTVVEGNVFVNMDTEVQEEDEEEVVVAAE